MVNSPKNKQTEDGEKKNFFLHYLTSRNKTGARILGKIKN
jgi:hypothetical protein